MFGFKVITQFEQGIVFRWGRALPDIRQPGLTWVNPFTDRLRKVNMQIIVAAVPAQEAITRDNVTLKVDAVVYYRVVDPVKAIINVQNYTLPVRPFNQALLGPFAQHAGVDWKSLGVLAAWGAAGALVAIRRFRWDPRPG